MSTAWLIVQIVLGVLGSILVWFVLGSLIAGFYQRHRGRTANHSPRPPARS